MTILYCKNKILDLRSPQVMGILNVTPDSFYDGGYYQTIDAALRRAEQMVYEGAAIIDVGGESTRPGADPVPLNQELDRVLPVIQALHSNIDAIISIDTSKPEVMSAAVAAGAEFINDVNALQAPNAISTAMQCNVPVCLMHRRGTPKTMQSMTDYDDLLQQINQFFLSRIEACEQSGISRDQIILDPGFGFAKTVEQNMQLIHEAKSFIQHGLPLLIGTSRKPTLSHITNRSIQDALTSNIAISVLAAREGYSIIRAHDVAATVEALKIYSAMFV